MSSVSLSGARPSTLHYPWLFLEVKTHRSRQQATYQALYAAMAGIALYNFVAKLAKTAAPTAYEAFKQENEGDWEMIYRSYTVAGDGSRWTVWTVELFEEEGVERYVSWRCSALIARLELTSTPHLAAFNASQRRQY